MADWRSDRIPRPSVATIQRPLLPHHSARRDGQVETGRQGTVAVPPNLKAAVFLALLFVQLSNAAYGVITKVALHGKGGVNPLVFSLLRDALSFPLLEAIALVVDGPQLPAKSDVGRFVLLGLFGMFGNQFCYILGLVYIDAGLASVINLLTPVCAWLFATAIGLDRFSWLQAAGVLCAVGGAMIFVGLFDLHSHAGPPTDDSGSGTNHANSGGEFLDTVKGTVAVFGSCVTMSIYYILMKPVLKLYSPVTVTAWSYFFGAFVMGVVSLMYVPWSQQWSNSPDPFKLCDFGHCPTVREAWEVAPKAWAAIAVAVVVNSVIKYGLTSFANKHVSVTVLAIWGTLVPVFTFAGEALVCSLQGTEQCAADGMDVEWHQRYLGAIGVLCGLGLVVWFRAGAPPEIGKLNRCRRRLLRLCARIDTATPIDSLR